MSADNGYVLRKNTKGQFVLQEFFASAEDFPAIETGVLIFDTLEAAILEHEEIEMGSWPSEYGLTTLIGTYPDK